jgi:hypothetical protein
MKLFWGQVEIPSDDEGELSIMAVCYHLFHDKYNIFCGIRVTVYGDTHDMMHTRDVKDSSGRTTLLNDMRVPYEVSTRPP